MKQVLILVFSNLKHDARLKRQIDFLKHDFLVTVVCFDADPIPKVTYIKLKQTKLTFIRKFRMGIALLLRCYSLAYTLFHDYGSLASKLKTEKFDIIIANDIDTLPLAFQIKKNNRDAKILFDAHEYAPRHFENSIVWKLFFQPFNTYLCKKYIKQTDAMTTVGSGLANEYRKNFKCNPIIITNATRYFEIDPVVPEENTIKLIHHGIANKSRRLELMIDVMNFLDERFTLDLILVTSDFASPKTKAYINELKDQASKNPRIKILPQLKSDQVVPFINSYDVGVFLLPPVNFNYANTLPNKLFDFIQARLAIAVGPTPEMAEIVREYDLGVVSEKFTAESLAEQLMKLTATNIQTFKSNATRAAKELNANKNEVTFKTLIETILN